MRDSGDQGKEPTTSHGPVNVVGGKVVRQDRHELRLVQGPDAPKIFALVITELVVGRSAEADIVVDSEDLSRKHAQLFFNGRDWSIRDLDSRNGVFLNGVKVHSATLCDGDTLQLGASIFEFREVRG